MLLGVLRDNEELFVKLTSLPDPSRTLRKTIQPQIPPSQVISTSVELPLSAPTRSGKGVGVVMLSAHYGNFILLYIAMVQAGYKVNVIMKRARDKEMEEYISQFRKERGIQTILCVIQQQLTGDDAV